MAVVGSACLLQKGGNAEFGHEKDKLTARYKVRVDDREDGPGVVVTAQGLPALNDPWEYGNDTNVLARHNGTKRPKRVGEFIWHVDCIFERTTSGGGGNDSQGNPADTPSDIQPTITPGSRVVGQRPIRNARFMWHVYPGVKKSTVDGVTRCSTTVYDPLPNLITSTLLPVSEDDASYVGAIINSAKMPHIPAPEEAVRMPVVVVNLWRRTWLHGVYDELLGTTNDSDYQIALVDGSGTTVYDRTFGYSHLLFHSYTPTQRQFGNQLWYNISFEFWVDTCWWHDLVLLDSGTTALVNTTGGEKKHEQIRGNDELPVSEPKPLNGGGGVLDEDLGPDDHVYNRWNIHRRADWSGLSL